MLGSADVSSLLAVADSFAVLSLYQILFKFPFYGSIKVKSELKKDSYRYKMKKIDAKHVTYR